MRNIGQFADRLDVRLLPRRSRWPVVRDLWARGGGSRVAAIGVLFCPERRRWQLLADFYYTTSKGRCIRVPKGAVINGLSIPWLCLRVFNPMGRFAEAGIAHDWQWQVVVRYLQRWGGETPANFEFANEVFYDGARTLNALPPEPTCTNRVLGGLVHVVWGLAGVACAIRPWLMWAAVSLNGRLQVWKYSRVAAKARREV